MIEVILITLACLACLTVLVFLFGCCKINGKLSRLEEEKEYTGKI